MTPDSSSPVRSLTTATSPPFLLCLQNIVRTHRRTVVDLVEVRAGTAPDGEEAIIANRQRGGAAGGGARRRAWSPRGSAKCSAPRASTGRRLEEPQARPPRRSYWRRRPSGPSSCSTGCSPWSVPGASYGDALAAEASLVVPDLAGFGASSQVVGGASAPTSMPISWPRRSGDHLGLAGEPAIIGAHSLGSLVAIHLARRHPEVGSRHRGLLLRCTGRPGRGERLSRANILLRLFVSSPSLAACMRVMRAPRSAGWLDG